MNQISPDPFDDTREGIRELRLYLEAAERSTARTRWSTIVLAVATVLCFVAAWNVEELAWFKNRREVVHHARVYYAASDSARSGMLKAKSDDREMYRRAHNWLEQVDLLPGPTPTGISINLVRHSRPSTTQPDTLTGKLTVDLGAVVLAQIEDQVERVWLDSYVTLDIPFLGITFDVNDLGLIAGLAFAIILLIQKLAADAEYQNLRRLFKVAHRVHRLRTTYELICMSQILTIPRRDFGTEQERKARSDRPNWIALFLPRVAPLLLNVAPAVLLTWIFVTNRRTTPIGFMTSPEATTQSMSGSLALLAIVILLTVTCVRSSVAITRLFDAVSGKSSGKSGDELGLGPDEV